MRRPYAEALGQFLRVSPPLPQWAGAAPARAVPLNAVTTSFSSVGLRLEVTTRVAGGNHESEAWHAYRGGSQDSASADGPARSVKSSASPEARSRSAAWFSIC